jgi:hypothetical protein
MYIEILIVVWKGHIVDPWILQYISKLVLLGLIMSLFSIYRVQKEIVNSPKTN